MALARRSVLAALPLLVLAACSDGDDSNLANEINRARYTSGDGSNLRWDEPDDRPDAPALSGEDLDGETVDTGDWAGSVIVVNFWGAWCAPCIREAPLLVEAAEALEGQNVEFLGINIRDDTDAALAFERRHGVPYPSIEDPQGEIALQFIDFGVSPNAIPSTILIDSESRVFSIWRGEFDSADVLIADIEKALEA